MKVAPRHPGRWALAAMLLILIYVATPSVAAAGRKLQAPSVNTPQPTVQVVNITAFHEIWLNNRPNTTFLDVRQKTLFQLSHVPGARNVPATTAKVVAAQFANKKRRVDPAKDVACYASDKQTAVTACGEFAKVKAYAKVKFFALEGGFAAWFVMQYPIATGPKN